jgi:DHA1 family bicyclomycin/chloramphenicol resistance-like MFS transporter
MQTSNNKLLTITLAGLSMVGPFAIDTYLPSFFNIGMEFAVSQELVQLTLSMYLLAYAIMALFHGTLSDSFGRRPVIFVALFVYIAASIGAMLAPTFDVLLISRIFQGMSAGAGVIVGQAIVRDKFTGAVAQKMMANIMMVFGLAPAIAPVIGGYISSHLSWRAVFAFLCLFGLLVTVCAWKFVPESLEKAKRQPFDLQTILANYWTAMKHPRFMMGTLAFSFVFSGLALYISSAPHFVIQVLQLPETAFAWLFLPLISGIMVGSAVNSRFAHKINPRKLLVAGFIVMAMGMLANITYNVLFAAAVPWAVIPVFLYSFGMSLAVPTMMLTTLGIFPEMKGLASSMMSFVQMLLFAIVSGLVAPLLYDSALKLAIGVAVGVAVSALCWFICVDGKTKQ